MPKKPFHQFRVALLVETSTKIGRDLLQGIRNYEHEQDGWNLSLQPGGLEQNLPDPRVWKGTGIIARATNPSLFSSVLKTGLPTVFFTLSDRQRRMAARPHVREVFVDARVLSPLAADHLIESGLRHFAFVGNELNPTWSQRRQLAFAERLKQAGFRCHVYPVDRRMAAVNWGIECRRMIRWLRDLPKPIGIMAANDACALRVLEACRAARFVVPEEISVIGVDDDELLCSLCHPTLSSIGLATVAAGYRVAQTLHALMLGRPVDPLPIVILPSHVIPRDSTATAFALDARVEKARRFILKQARQMIQVRDVVEHVGVSRRSLETHFARSLGRSILQEILRVRLEQVKARLLGTRQSVYAIAQASGFADAHYMSKAFKKTFGLSPQAFRACPPVRVSGPPD